MEEFEAVVANASSTSSSIDRRLQASYSPGDAVPARDGFMDKGNPKVRIYSTGQYDRKMIFVHHAARDPGSCAVRCAEVGRLGNPGFTLHADPFIRGLDSRDVVNHFANGVRSHCLCGPRLATLAENAPMPPPAPPSSPPAPLSPSPGPPIQFPHS